MLCTGAFVIHPGGTTKNKTVSICLLVRISSHSFILCKSTTFKILKYNIHGAVTKPNLLETKDKWVAFISQRDHTTVTVYSKTRLCLGKTSGYMVIFKSSRLKFLACLKKMLTDKRDERKKVPQSKILEYLSWSAQFRGKSAKKRMVCEILGCENNFPFSGGYCMSGCSIIWSWTFYGKNSVNPYLLRVTTTEFRLTITIQWWE